MAWSSPRTWSTEETVTAAHMNQEVRDNLDAVLPDGVAGESWSPTLEADSSNATATVTGRKYQVGALMFVWARFVLTDPGSGIYFVTLPTAASGITASTWNGAGQTIGSFTARDTSPPLIVSGSVVLATSTTVYFNGSSIPGLGPSSRLESTVPWTWAADDVLTFHAVYPVA